MTGEQTGAKAPRRTITFEVSVRRQRRWEVHATYRAYERESALEDARALEKEPMVDGTKVTKETWRHDTNRIDTAVIYRSRALEEEMIEIAAARPKPLPRRKVGFGARFAARVTNVLGGSEDEAVSAAGAVYTPSRSAEHVLTDVSMSRAIPWILIAFVGACIVGAGAAVLASMAMQAAIESGTWLTRQEQSGILIGSFLGATGLTFFIALRRILAKLARDRRVRQQQQLKLRSLEKAKKSADGMPADVDPDAGKLSAEAGLHPDMEDDPEGRRGVTISSEDALAQGRSETPVGRQIQGFESVLRSRLADRLGSFDASQRFALNVYVAGAVERLAQGDGDRTARQRLLTAPLIRLGTAPDIAARFGQTLDEHLTRPRALEIFNRGRDAASRFIEDDADADVIDPLSAIAAWDTPVSEGGEPESDIVAIMFTDIVESTARTHAIGDQAGQVIVRAHNAVVRDTLKRCDGTEIKHTGDGIIASFAIASHAVEAARLIQRSVAALSESDPAAAFELRIGINVGEPVRENDDLFGTAVQLAARLCGVGESGQIIVSRVVRDLCSGKNYGFDVLGSVELKGIPGQTELYALRWRDGALGAGAVPAAAE
ncbi:MAG: adenylate/guanylate cyclase domain-containing protein [Alphaproteobacteria bacterium]|jgi:adenylate cyclase